MATALYRIIKYGFINFWRNGWLSTATMVIMILALVVIEGVIMFSFVAGQVLTSLQDRIDISVYFKSEASEDTILKVKRSLESLAEVKGVEYISRENALNIFKQRHTDDATISQAIEELNGNPLLASLNVKARDPREYGIIASYLEDDSLKNSVDKVTYAQNQTVIERLVAIIDTSNNVGVALAIFLASVAVLVTFNTIRLAIYSNRDEIGIMRLVGASNGFIRGPYIVEGVIYGVLSGVASVLIMIPIIKFASPYIGVFIPEVNLTAYLSDNFVKLLGYQLFFGIGLGIISSVIVIRRYLRV